MQVDVILHPHTHSSPLQRTHQTFAKEKNPLSLYLFFFLTFFLSLSVGAMVFPSLPIYLDPPNWSQQANHQPLGIGSQNLPIPPILQPPPPTTITAVGGGGYQGSIRPGSMADRARLAKIHQPDVSLKCPRCESTNTKFCYYNNYSLSQPRHFCKTCRRYWTRGGALRNVPVGGGCRRNKRSKGTTNTTTNTNRSKSPLNKLDHHHLHGGAVGGSSSASANSSSSGRNNSNSNNNNDVNVMNHMQNPPPPTQFPFLPTTLHHHHYSSNSDHASSLLFGPNPPSSSLVVRNGGGGGGDVELQQWRLPNLQQFPGFLSNLEAAAPPQIGLFHHQFDHQQGGENNNGEYVRDHLGGRFVRSSNNSNNNKITTMADDDDSSVVVVGGGMIPHHHQVNNNNSVIKVEENNSNKNHNNQGGLSLLSKNNNNVDLFWRSSSNNGGSGNINHPWNEAPTTFTSPTTHLL